MPGFYLQSEPPVRGGLGSENTFEQCVSEMALAGFTGSEVGNKYPKNPEVLKKALSLRGIEICNQWFSSLLLTKPFAEVERMMEHTDPEYVNLLFDTGHFAYCGEDPLEMVGKYVGRIKHVHLKDIRPEVVEKVKKGNFVNPSQKMFASWVQAVSVLVQRILSNHHIDLPNCPSASLSSISVATATPHSSALHMEQLFYVNIAET